MTCSVVGCEKPTKTRGWCVTHYHRYRAHGTPFGSSRPIRGSVRQFILDNVAHDGDECLIWPFSRNQTHGYGEIRKEHFGASLAHRAMCIAAHGQPPSNRHEAAHSCGKGRDACVNPKHLSWKTPSENNGDKRDHGTQPWGEGMWHMAKLTLDQAKTIKYSDKIARELAAEYNVSMITIYRIKNNQNWRGI